MIKIHGIEKKNKKILTIVNFLVRFYYSDFTITAFSERHTKAPMTTRNGPAPD